MTFFEKIFTKLNSKKAVYQVGQRLYSDKRRKGLTLEREIFVNEIRHFRVSIEGMTIKKNVILSENALLEDQFKCVEGASDKNIYL
ncbi:MAG: hypothetical protein ACJZ8K_05400 [Paracoccaceae bacterium]